MLFNPEPERGPLPLAVCSNIDNSSGVILNFTTFLVLELIASYAVALDETKSMGRLFGSAPLEGWTFVFYE